VAKRIVIAIDGPAGSGKSTLARRLADKLGFLYIDTGAMYRAIALWALRLNTPLDDHQRLEQLALNAEITLGSAGEVKLNGEDITRAIRSPEVSQAASCVSAVPGVRKALVAKQQQMGSQQSVVMEGRDIGTVVFPDAQVKIFLDASHAERSRRRFHELSAKGQCSSVDEASSDLAARDERDRTRAESPLLQAPDAVYLDSTSLTLDEAEEQLLRLVRERTSNGKEIHA